MVVSDAGPDGKFHYALNHMPISDVLQRIRDVMHLTLPHPRRSLLRYVLAAAVVLFHVVGPGFARRFCLLDVQLSFWPKDTKLKYAMIASSFAFGCCVADFWLMTAKSLPLYERCSTRFELLRATHHPPTAAQVRQYCLQNNHRALEKLTLLPMNTALNMEAWRKSFERVSLEAALDRSHVEEMLVLGLLGLSWSVVCTVFVVFNSHSVSTIACVLIFADTLMFGIPIVFALLVCTKINTVHDYGILCLMQLREHLLREADPERAQIPSHNESPARHHEVAKMQASRKRLSSVIHQCMTPEDKLSMLHQMEYLQAVIDIDRSAKRTERLLGMKVTTSDVNKWLAILLSMSGSLFMNCVQKFLT